MKAEHPMDIVTKIAEAMQEVLGEKADELARETGFVKRERKLSGSGFVQSLVFGWLAQSVARMETLSQSAANIKIEISRQGMQYRFTEEAARFLEAVLYESIKQVVAAQAIDNELLKRFKGCMWWNSTVIILPDALAEIWQGCEGSALKISVCWDLLSGQLVEVYLHDAREHDQKAPMHFQQLPQGAIRLADLGYFKLDVLEQHNKDGSGWVTRYKGGTKLLNDKREELDLVELLSAQKEAIYEQEVYLGASHRIRCRVVAQRIPPDKLRQRREQLARWESRQQKKASRTRWALLAWSIYLTNVSEELLDASEVMLMARVRWQIELLFKLWKDSVDIDDWRSQHPWRILCEVYAKLIACILQHWLMLVGGLHALNKSMAQATPVIQNWAWALAYALNQSDLLPQLLEHIGTILAATCHISTSSSSPPTFQRISQKSA